MGDGSGFDIIKWLREVRKSTAPIILISGYGDSQNVIYGLDIGADDYLKLSCCPASSSAYFDGKPLPLTKNERLMLEALIERPNWTVPHDELASKVWGSGSFVTENTISVTLSGLRKKIGP